MTIAAARRFGVVDQAGMEITIFVLYFRRRRL
jgi:hypothetical protein